MIKSKKLLRLQNDLLAVLQHAKHESFYTQTRDSTISKNTLIDIIKTEFELTIDMEDYLRKIGPEYEKNYQIWHHRRCISEVLSDPNDLQKEKSFLQEIFKSDAKNYHAWSYRIWLVERF